MAKSGSSLKSNWSASERWLVVGVAIIVLSIVVPVWLQHIGARRLAMARQDVRALVMASERFFVEYGAWPSPHMGTAGDVRYGREWSNELVVNALRAVDGPGNEGYRLNPNRIVFLDPPRYRRGRSGLDASGAFLDPWGTPYQVVLDTDLNNTTVLSHTIYPNQIGVGVVVWSFGPDRRPDTPKDILSWRE